MFKKVITLKNIACLTKLNIFNGAMASSTAANFEKLLSDPARHYNFKEFQNKRKCPSVVVVDVREPTELLETGSIPGSINIPLNELEKALGSMTDQEFHKKYNHNLPDKETHLIFSCRSGKRSLSAFQKALHLGYLNSSNYKGGWLDWSENLNK